MKIGFLDAEVLYLKLLNQISTAYGSNIFCKPDGILPIGILTGGAWIAERIASDMAPIDRVPLFGALNIALHRDDFAEKGFRSSPQSTTLPFSIESKHLLLLDDVLFTGRTIRAALNELYDYGRPAIVDLAVLVDRGGRELPISARFVGIKTKISKDKTLVLNRGSKGFLSFVLE